MPARTPGSAVEVRSSLPPSPVPPPPAVKPAQERFALYRIAVQLPPDILGYVVTHGRPEIRVELVNRMDLGEDRVMIEARVFGPGASELTSTIRDFPHVDRIEVHPENDRSALYRVVFKQPATLKVIRRHRILTRYPVVYVDGWMRFETLAQGKEVRELVRDLRREVGPSRVEAVRQGSVSPSVLGLSPPQLVVFRSALAAGYFASPRRISISKLAKQLGRSKSTVSEHLSQIQHRLAESALRLNWGPLTSA
jgi:predicted DNA binding protein